jgi:hypothetical protein
MTCSAQQHRRHHHHRARALAVGACLPLLTVLALASGCTRSTPPDPTQPQGQDHPVQPPPSLQSPTGSRPISFEQEEPWRSTLDRFEATLGLARTPASPQELSSLTLELRCSSGDRTPTEPAKSLFGPLAEMSSIRVYSNDDLEHALLVCHRSGISYATATVPSFEYDGRGPIVLLMECISIPFAAHAEVIRAGHPYHLTVLCLDASGRTMASEEVSGDQAETPLTVLVAPPGGWTSFLLPPPRGDASAPGPVHAARPPPKDVGVASVEEDGTLQLMLRSVEDDGTIAEALLVITTGDQRYAAMAAHLHHPKPGTSCPIPPFSVEDGTAAPPSVSGN